MRIPTRAEVDAFCGCPTTRWQRALGFLAPALLLGSIVFVVTIMTERLPAVTPHQSMRGWRIYIMSPLLWLLVAVHIGFGMYQAGMLELPFLSS